MRFHNGGRRGGAGYKSGDKAKHENFKVAYLYVFFFRFEEMNMFANIF